MSPFVGDQVRTTVPQTANQCGSMEGKLLRVTEISLRVYVEACGNLCGKVVLYKMKLSSGKLSSGVG